MSRTAGLGHPPAVRGAWARRPKAAPAVLGITACAVLALSGCGPSEPAAAKGVPSVPGPTNAPSTAAGTSVPLPDDDGPTDAAAGGLDQQAGREAGVRAGAFMRAWARTDRSQQQWWAGIAGYFTPAAATVYRLVDVDSVPPLRVREQGARLAPSSTRYRAQVGISTTAGTYVVVLVGVDQTWLVDRLNPPARSR